MTSRQLLVALVVALPGYACWFATRGDLAGTRAGGEVRPPARPRRTVRLLAALIFVTVDAGTAAYGAAFALSPWLTLLLTWTQRRMPPGAAMRPGPGWDATSRC